jgi:hypothetical protein
MPERDCMGFYDGINTARFLKLNRLSMAHEFQPEFCVALKVLE